MLIRGLVAMASLLLLLAMACGGGGDKAASPAPKPAGAPAQAEAPTLSGPAKPATAPLLAEKPKYGGTLVFRQRRDPKWDPAQGLMASDEGRVFHFIHARLFSVHRGSPTCQLWPADPELAESWKLINDRTLDIKIKQAKFSAGPPTNGRQITAQDVAESFQRQFKLMPGAKPAADLTESVEVVDPRTVRFVMKTPFPTYLDDVLGQQWTVILPSELRAPQPTLKSSDHLNVGSGAFLMTTYNPSANAEYIKNPDYFEAGLPYLNGISQPIIPDESTLVAGLKAGKIDAGEIRTPQFQAELAQTAPQIQLQRCPYPASYVIDIRTDKTPLNNLKVRQALSMALDRDALGRVAYAGLFYQKDSPIHIGLKEWRLDRKEYSPAAIKVLTYNPDEARKLLTEAGYPNGFELTVNFGPGFPLQSSIAEFLSTAWPRIGVKTILKPLEPLAFSAVAQGPGDFDGSLVNFASSNTPYEALYHYFRCGVPRNSARVCDPDIDRLLGVMTDGRADEKVRKAAVNDLQKLLVERQYRFDLPQYSTAGAFQPWVKNAWYHTDSFADVEAVRFAWLDK
jgi:peptide/nickel transport system substrate-binding protein